MTGRGGPAAVHARRLTAQLLAGRRAGDPAAVAERLLAIQAQDPRAARLAIRARTSGVTAADVDHELTERRSLVITTLNRGTLHLVRTEDYALLQSLTTPPLMTTSTTRLGQEGLTPDQARRGVDVIERAIADRGPQTRGALRDALERAGIPVAGQTFIHLIFRASIEGRIVRGPMAGREHAFALVRDWLPASATAVPPREAALAELARRYLAGHGPACDADLARWSGLALRDARAGLEAIASRLEQLPGGLVDLAGRPPAARLPPPRLLGAFEPLLLGWTSRDDVLGDGEPAVVSGGVFRGFGLVRGRAAAGWRYSGHQIEVTPFPGLAKADAAALERDAVALRRFLGWARR
ncbi:MAG: crosslink repair DNA glycosylase YcaQ family protein [Solirubrobacteraceae bacterium]